MTFDSRAHLVQARCALSGLRLSARGPPGRARAPCPQGGRADEIRTLVSVLVSRAFQEGAPCHGQRPRRNAFLKTSCDEGVRPRWSARLPAELG